METALLLAGKITELTLIVLMGMALVKFKLLTSEHSRTLSVIALYLISPSVMIHAFQIENTPDIIDGLKLSVALAVVFHILLIVLGRLFKTLFKLDTLEHAATVYTNSGNLIIPLVMSIFGPQWVIYTSGFIIVQMFLFWTHLRLLLCGRGNLAWKTVLTNINILSIFIGVFMFAFQIKLPHIIDNTLATVGGMIGPVAMLVAVCVWGVPRARHRWSLIACGMLIAGICGNLTDRIFRAPGPLRGHVVDFISLPHFAVFNVADIFITCTAVLIVLTTVSGHHRTDHGMDD